MLQNICKTLGFKKNMVYKTPTGGGGGKPYPASGLCDFKVWTSDSLNEELPKKKWPEKSLKKMIFFP